MIDSAIRVSSVSDWDAFKSQNYPKSDVYLMDCIEGMKSYPDEYFDLAVVDPPYGIGENWKKDKNSKFYKHRSTYKNNSIPGPKYFKELFRVSKNQIVWGANYYTEYLKPRNSWIVWDKNKDYETQHMAEGELAWTSFNIPLRIISMIWNGCCTIEKRYGKHPHEKPVALYDWIFEKYAKPGDKILDTHLGSGSSRIAANKAGLDFTGFEIDEDYFNDSEERFKNFISQARLF